MIAQQSAHVSLSRETTRMIEWAVLALLCGGVSAGSHTLQYFYTSMSPMTDLPEFVVVGYVDDAQFVLYDSDRKRMIPRQRWMAEIEGPEYWEQQTQAVQRWEQKGKNNLAILLSRTNQTGGSHTFQVMYGCELRDDGSTAGFYQHAWDGKDLISFDKEHLVWVTAVKWAENTKHKWDHDRAGLEQDKGYLEKSCIQWLKNYLEAGDRELKPVAPRVFPSVNKASPIRPSELSCLVTGFYPRDIEVTLLRNGEPITDTESSGILPNHDGTYQLLRWAQIELGDGATYSCQYDQGGNVGAAIRDWDGTFRLTPGSPEGTNLGMIVGIVIGAVALIALLIGAIVWKRRGGEKKSGYSQANQRAESSSSSSAEA